MARHAALLPLAPCCRCFDACHDAACCCCHHQNVERRAAMPCCFKRIFAARSFFAILMLRLYAAAAVISLTPLIHYAFSPLRHALAVIDIAPLPSIIRVFSYFAAAIFATPLISIAIRHTMILPPLISLLLALLLLLPILFHYAT